MRAVFCLLALLCASDAYAGTPGISGEWAYYGNQDGTVRIDEASGIVEEGTGASYDLLDAQGDGWRLAAKKGSSFPGDARKIRRMHEDVLLFSGVKNPILVRKGVLFKAPREKIRGRWHYAAQMNEVFYYDAEFDLDARKMVEISRPEGGSPMRGEDRPLEMLLDAQAELALRGAGGAVYHFTRLGGQFLVLEATYASTRHGHKILMERVPRAAQQAKAAAASKTKAEKKSRQSAQKQLAREGRRITD
jgi:hypothetical protein